MTDFDQNDSINPGLGELLQEDEASFPAVPVRLIGPTHTQLLPARNAFSRHIDTSLASDPENVAEDLRRGYITMYCTTQPIFVGHDKQSVLDGTAAQLIAGLVITLPTSAPIWIKGTNAAASGVNYWLGQWAD